MKEIYRGIWADKLENGQELPFGGSRLSDTIDKKILLDFDNFEEQLEGYQSPQRISGLYEQKKDNLEKWLSQHDSDVNPYMFFTASVVQKKVQELLEVKPGEESTISKGTPRNKHNQKLSDLKGIAECAEFASLGQYILQNVLQKGSSSYMSGVIKSSGILEEHSFIVLKNPDSKTYIFDIAKPKRANNLPRLLETENPINYETFANTKDRLISATEVLEGGKLSYGVKELSYYNIVEGIRERQNRNLASDR